MAGVCSQQLNYHFQSLVPLFCAELHNVNSSIQRLTEAVKEGGDDKSLQEELARFEAIKACAAAIMGAVNTPGVNFLCSELGSQIEHETSVSNRQWGCWLAEQFFRHSKADFLEFVPVLLRYLLGRVVEVERDLQQAVSAWWRCAFKIFCLIEILYS